MNEIRTFLGSMLALTAVSCGHHPSVSQEEIACVRDFIRTSWDASVQYNPADSQTLIGLAAPLYGSQRQPDLSGTLLLGYLFHQRGARSRRTPRSGEKQH